jgi:hypothetical protein
MRSSHIETYYNNKHKEESWKQLSFYTVVDFRFHFLCFYSKHSLCENWFFFLFKNSIAGYQWLTPVNPSYLGDKDQEDHGLRPVQANSSRYSR